MYKSWPKEDRHCWQKSEVMSEFEKKIISNAALLEKLSQQKLDLKSIKTDLEGATKAAKELNKELVGSAADDGTVHATKKNESKEEPQCDDADCPTCKEKKNIMQTAVAKKEILQHLNKMAQKAISEKDIVLAYRIERAIAEVEDD